MTWLRLATSPLVWALASALAAAALFWLWQGAREDNAALRASLRGYEEAAAVTNRFLTSERERTADLILSLEELARVPDTNACADSPSMRAVLDRLRRD